MSKRVLVAVNARARRGSAARTLVLGALRAAGHTIVEVPLDGRPRTLSDAIVAHRDAIDVVVVGGGDGTLRTAIAGLIETKLPLAIVPLGTFNELARTVGVSPAPADIATLVDHGAAMQLDAGCVNGAYYFNEASIGLSTRVTALQTSDVKRRLGMLAVPITTLRALRWVRPLHLDVTSDDGTTQTLRAVQLTVANSYRFAGVVEDPDGSLEDGQLRLYAIDVRGWWNALEVIIAVARRALGQAPEVVSVRGRTFRVASRHRGRHRVFADSEEVAELPADFSVVPSAVTILVPPERVGAIR
jgi:YegS/Rv2252/BmrU family lipid kinase